MVFVIQCLVFLLNNLSLRYTPRCCVYKTAVIMPHSFTCAPYLHSRVTERCFIVGQSLILSSITIGDGAIVGGGSVVIKGMSPHCAVAGHPPSIVEQGMVGENFGRLIEAYENERQLRSSAPDAARASEDEFQKRQAKADGE